jgi:hypothetical protein
MMQAATSSGLLVFSDDWGRHPSSCQHLVRHLLPHHPVYWVNTIGTRKPRLDRATLSRGVEKLRHWFAASRNGDQLPPNLSVFNPKMWPWLSTRLDRKLNGWLLSRQLQNRLGSSMPPTAITTIPIVAEFMDALPVRRWVYYCVDDFSVWPGLDQEPLRRMEQKLVERADTIIAVSETLQERLARMGHASHLLTHGVDPDFWKGDQSFTLPMLANVERPLIVFWGVIDRRMEVGWIKELAAGLERGTIVLVGPQADPDPELARTCRVLLLQPVEFAKLPQLAREAGVLIMPYADLPVTRAMQPLKLKEYLATGKPAVVRELPATRPWGDCLDLADSLEAFARAVRLRLTSGLPGEQRAARKRLAQETWAAKAEQFYQWAFQC